MGRTARQESSADAAWRLSRNWLPYRVDATGQTNTDAAMLRLEFWARERGVQKRAPKLPLPERETYLTISNSPVSLMM